MAANPHSERLIPSNAQLSREVLKLLGILGVLVLLGYFFRHGGNFARKPPEPTHLVDFKVASEQQQTICGPASSSGRAMPFEMVYSADKRSWIEFAASRFAALCPNIQVKLTAMEDFAAISGMLAEELRPTVWAPTDDLSVRYLQQRAKQTRNPALWSFTERTSVVESPLVLLIWQDRLQILSTVLREQPSNEGQWARSLCAGIPIDPDLSGLAQEQMVPGSWVELYSPLLAPSAADRKERFRTFRSTGPGELPTMDELGKWGRVKIGHAMPTRFVAGLSSIYLLSYDYLRPPTDKAELSISDFVEKKVPLRRWLRRCEAGLELETRAVDALTESLFASGPARYDGIVTYEHMTLPFLDRLDATAGRLKKLVIVYPKPTLVARHPVIVFSAQHPEQQAAARRWLAFLLSKEMQQKAIEWGFRPANPSISIADYAVEQNRFLHLRRFGVLPRPQLSEAPSPDGPLLQDLAELWGEATGRN